MTDKLVAQMTDEQHAEFMSEVRRHHAELASLTVEQVRASKEMVAIAANPKPAIGLRDWFAGQALAAIISKIPLHGFPGEFSHGEKAALGAYDYADAMIDARECAATSEPD